MNGTFISNVAQHGLTVTDDMHLAAQIELVQYANRIRSKVYTSRITCDIELFFEDYALPRMLSAPMFERQDIARN